jgi:hypothetical protein
MFKEMVQQLSEGGFEKLINNEQIRRIIQVSSANCNRKINNSQFVNDNVNSVLFFILNKIKENLGNFEEQGIINYISTTLPKRLIDEYMYDNLGMKPVFEQRYYTPFVESKIKDCPVFDKDNTIPNAIYDAIDKANLGKNERIAFTLYWDLDGEPQDRERGQWTGEKIANYLGLSQRQTYIMLAKSLERVRNAGKFRNLHRSNINN